MVFPLSILVACMIVYWYGLGERYGAYIVKKKQKVWTVHHEPRFILFCRNRHSFLKLRDKSFQLIAHDLPDDCVVREESLWLDGRKDGASHVEIRKPSRQEQLLGKAPYWRNIYNWRFSRRKQYSQLFCSEWTAEAFKQRFSPKKKRSLGDEGVASAIVFFMMFQNIFGTTLVITAVQLMNNFNMYDILYNSADTAMLAGAEQQQTTTLAWDGGGSPSLWTQTLNDNTAIVTADRLFQENLYVSLSSNFVNTHVYFGNNSTPGYTDTTLNNYITYVNTFYGGTPYKIGVQMDMPIRVDTNLLNSAIQTLLGKPWSKQMTYNIKTTSTFPFLLYDSSHQSGYLP